MQDFSEFRRHWRPLLGASIGMGSALSLNSYIVSNFAPYMMKDFGWTPAQWALLGVVQILLMLCMPIAGRLTDLFGVWRVAATGALAFPVFLVAIATMNGDIRLFLAIYIAQTIVCSVTTSTVYSRVVAAAFKVRRGLALGICGSAPPLIGGLGSPLVADFVGQHGWRAGYLAVAGFCLVGGIAALALLPRDKPSAHEPTRVAHADRPVGVYRDLAAMPAFWIMLAATFLVNTPFTLATTQLKNVATAQHLSDSTAAWLVSAFAVASIVGRVISGVAVDALPGHIVAAVGFALPSTGLAILASSYDSVGFVATALVLIGLTFGAEGDVIPFLITRVFGIGVFSTVLGLMTAAISSAIALGSLLLAATLKSTAGFETYLLTAAACSLAGSVLFLLLGRFMETAVARPA